MKKDDYHQTVLVGEILDLAERFFKGKKDLNLVDATLGTAGHAIALAKRGWRVLGIEQDSEMIEVARERIEEEGLSEKIKIFNGNFRNVDKIFQDARLKNISMVLFDLGVSNLQLTSKERGFSFSQPETELDMRVDRKEQKIKAWELLNFLRKDQLVNLFSNVLDQRKSRKLSDEIVDFRSRKSFNTVGDFLEVCKKIRSKPGLNPATLPFLALRIAVNSEIENLSEALPKVFEMLDDKGLLLVITFHSGEDRVVKKYFKNLDEEGMAKVFEEILPTEREIERNQRSRSAKLRYIEKK